MRKDRVPGHHANVMLNLLTVSQTWKLNGIQSITLEAVSEPVLEFLKDAKYFNIIQFNNYFHSHHLKMDFRKNPDNSYINLSRILKDFDRRCLTPRGLTQPYDQCCGTEYPNR